MNKILLKEYKTPTDVFILGDAEDTKPDFCLTDDECTLNIVRGLSSVCITTFGFGFILTKEELISAIGNIEYETIGEGVFLEDFTGKIYVVVENREGTAEFNENVDLEEYLYHQVGSDDVEIFLSIEDTKSWVNFFFYKPFPIEMLRKIITTQSAITNE